MHTAKKFLSPPAVPRVRYQRNFIKTAVIELRFPTLLELESKPPTKFQSLIRKSYPFYEPQVVQHVGGADVGAPEHHYLFHSKDKKWTVVIKSFAVAIETSKYEDFENFFTRFQEILQSAKEIIDSDFFTRVGLRYVNSIPIEDGNPEGWIRSDLIRPITGGVLGDTESCASIIQGYMERGRYGFRHGLHGIDGDNKSGVPNYRLDFDYYEENVEFGDVEKLIRLFNEVNFSFFSWCLGDKAKKILGEGKPK